MTSLGNFMLNAGDIPHPCDAEVISANAVRRQLYRFATTRPSDRQRPRTGLPGPSVARRGFRNTYLEMRIWRPAPRTESSHLVRECGATLTITKANIMARRERPNAQALFNKYDSYGLQQHYKQRMLEAIDNAGEAQLAGDTETLETDFAQQFSLESPILIEGAVSVAAEEAEVDVTGDWRFGSFGDGESIPRECESVFTYRLPGP